jgi:hypothetical protein
MIILVISWPPVNYLLDSLPPHLVPIEKYLCAKYLRIIAPNRYSLVGFERENVTYTQIITSNYISELLGILDDDQTSILPTPIQRYLMSQQD